MCEFWYLDLDGVVLSGGSGLCFYYNISLFFDILILWKEKIWG